MQIHNGYGSQAEVAILLLEFLHLIFEFTVLTLLRLHVLVLSVVAAADGQPQRNTVHLELFGQVAQKKAFIVTCKEVFCVDEEDEVRWAHTSLNQIVYLESVVLSLGQGLQFLKILQPIVEQSSRHSCIPLIIDSDHPVQHLVKSTIEFGADEDQGVSVYFSKTLLNLLKQVIFGLVAKGFLDCFPLVDCNDHRPSFLDDFTDQGKVIHHKGGKGVHHVHHHVTLRHVHHCADLHFTQVLLVGLVQVRSVQSRRVNQLHLPPLVIDSRTDCVSGCVGCLRRHQLILSQYLIDDSGLPHIRTANNADFDRALEPQILGLRSPRIGKALFRPQQKLLRVILIQILILLRTRVDFTEIALPFLYAEIFASVVGSHLYLQFLHQLLEFVHPLLPLQLKLLFDWGRYTRVDVLQNLYYSAALLCGTGEHLIETQFSSLIDHFPLVEQVVALVTDQDQLAMCSKGLQVLHKIDVSMCNGLLGINHQQDKVSLVNGRDCLLEYFLLEPLTHCTSRQAGLHPRGINYRCQSVENIELFTITCGAVLLVHHSHTFPHQTVEQTAFAAVRQSHQGNPELVLGAGESFPWPQERLLPLFLGLFPDNQVLYLHRGVQDDLCGFGAT